MIPYRAVTEQMGEYFVVCCGEADKYGLKQQM